MPTNNPLPSSSLEDFKDNSIILDHFVNSQEEQHPDRFGRARPTITGIIREAFNVRTDISNMNETLIGQSRWDAVPKNTSLSLGGDNGALNKQAQALFNRTEMLKTHAREALRRTYLEVGLNLVEGSFEAGGTLVNANDVLLQERTGKAFTGPAGTVAPGTNPASGGFVDKSGGLLRHELATSNGATKVGTSDGGSVQDFIDGLAAPDSDVLVGGVLAGELANNGKQNSIYLNKLPKYSAPELVGMVSKTGEPAVTLISGQSLAFAELIAPSANYANIEVFFEFDYISGALGVDFSFNATAMDNLDRANSSTINLVSGQLISPNVYKVTTATTVSAKAYAAWSVRALTTGMSANIRLRKITVVESGSMTGVTDFSVLALRNNWSVATSQHSSLTTRQRVSIPSGQGEVVNADFVTVSPLGSTEFGRPPYNLNYFIDTLCTQTNTTKNARLMAGDYRPYRQRYYISPTTDVNLIAAGEKAVLNCGRELPTSSWVVHQTAPNVFVRRAAYNADAHWDANVRANIAQPMLSGRVPSGKERSILNFAFTPVTSVAEVEAAPNRSYYDGTNIYFSFPTTSTGFEDLCFVYVSESQIGVRFPNPTTPTNLIAYNIDIIGAELWNWRFRPNAIGNKYIALHNCSAISSATREGFSIDRINCELVNCYGDSNRLDDFNFHDGGHSILIKPVSKSSGDDGISHHETCTGYVYGAVIRYPAAAYSVPAFGARVIHDDCVGYAATSGTTSGKGYTGTFAVLSGIGQDSVSSASYSAYNNCQTFLGVNDYSCVSQNSGLSELDVNRPTNNTGRISVFKSGNVDKVVVNVKV